MTFSMFLGECQTCNKETTVMRKLFLGALLIVGLSLIGCKDDGGGEAVSCCDNEACSAVACADAPCCAAGSGCKVDVQ